MVRLSLAGVTALLLAGGAVGVSAVDEVAVEEAATPPVWVTLTEQPNCFAGSPSKYSTGPGLAKRVRGLSFVCDNTYTDPRGSGRRYVVYNEDCFEDGVCVGWGTLRQGGPDGAWIGWWNEIDDEADNTSFYMVMTGTEAYEGMTFVAFSMGVWEQFPNEYGVIYEGDPPPVEPPPAG